MIGVLPGTRAKLTGVGNLEVFIRNSNDPHFVRCGKKLNITRCECSEYHVTDALDEIYQIAKATVL